MKILKVRVRSMVAIATTVVFGNLALWFISLGVIDRGVSSPWVWGIVLLSSLTLFLCIIIFILWGCGLILIVEGFYGPSISLSESTESERWQ